MIPVFVLQLRMLLGNMPCDEKIESDEAKAVSPFGNRACDEMLKQRHGWTDKDLLSNAAVARERDELCRASTFVLDHARGSVGLWSSLSRSSAVVSSW